MSEQFGGCGILPLSLSEYVSASQQAIRFDMLLNAHLHQTISEYSGRLPTYVVIEVEELNDTLFQLDIDVDPDQGYIPKEEEADVFLHNPSPMVSAELNLVQAAVDVSLSPVLKAEVDAWSADIKQAFIAQRMLTCLSSVYSHHELNRDAASIIKAFDEMRGRVYTSLDFYRQHYGVSSMPYVAVQRKLDDVLLKRYDAWKNDSVAALVLSQQISRARYATYIQEITSTKP